MKDIFHDFSIYSIVIPILVYFLVGGEERTTAILLSILLYVGLRILDRIIQKIF